MAWDGFGVFNRLRNWVTDESNLIKIEADFHDSEDDNLAAGIQACVAKNGENTATGNLPMGGFKHTAVGDGNARNNYSAIGQIQDGYGCYQASDTGAADAYAISLTPAITVYVAGQRFQFIAANACSGAAVTLDVSGLGGESIKLIDGGDPHKHAILANMIVDVQYDGTNFVLLNPNIAGKQTIFIPVAAMTPTSSNGCSFPTTVETTANRPDMNVMDFDTASDEHAQFQIALPKSWDLGTVTFQAFWTTTNTATASVAWGLQGVAVADNGTIDVAYGTAIVVTDNNQSAAEDMLVSAESAAVTIAGAPAVDEMCFFRVFRDVSADNMAQDARLIGIKLHFTTNLWTDR